MSSARRDYEFRGTGAGLFGIQLMKLVCILALAASILLLALVPLSSPTVLDAVGKVWPGLRHAIEWASDRMQDLSETTPFFAFWKSGWRRWLYPIAGIPVSIFLLLQVQTAIDRYRIHNTYVYGLPVSRNAGCMEWLATTLACSAIMSFTGGLAAPWVFAIWKRYEYRCWRVASRHAFDFDGFGLEVLACWLVSTVALPFRILTAGFLSIITSWLWVQWEQSHIRVPDPSGQLHPVRFEGTFGDYFAQSLKQWALTVVTLGFYRPWALAERWHWLAEHTTVLGPEPSSMTAPPPEKPKPGRTSAGVALVLLLVSLALLGASLVGLKALYDRFARPETRSF